jgi:TRAP-type mannitol/chloroaromatic compound transport system permease large subunit
MTYEALGLSMLVLIVIVIMLGFPDSIHADGAGDVLRLHRLLRPRAAWFDNHVFDLFVQRAYGAMTNETLLSIPLFVLMGVRDGARGARRQDVLQRAARVPPRAGLAGSGHAHHLHLLGHLPAAWSARSSC